LNGGLHAVFIGKPSARMSVYNGSFFKNTSQISVLCTSLVDNC